MARSSPAKMILSPEAIPSIGVLPHSEVRSRISHLETAAHDGATIDELAKMLGSITVGYITITLRIEGPIYRGRINGDFGDFRRLSELWYPPAELAKQNRANRAGVPVFYCSDSRFTVIRELEPPLGKEITILKCVSRTPNQFPNVFCLGMSKSVLRRGTTTLNKRVEPQFDLRQFSIAQKNHSLIIDSFFSRVFRYRGNENYNLTNAITERYLRAKEMDGIMYPSVRPDAGNNMALRPVSADRFYRPESIFKDRFEKHLGNNRLKMRCVGTAQVAYDETLIWEQS